MDIFKTLELSKSLLHTLQRMAFFANPKFFIRQNLRKSTFNIRRGLIIQVKKLFEKYNATFLIENKRIDKPHFGLELRDDFTLIS